MPTDGSPAPAVSGASPAAWRADDRAPPAGWNLPARLRTRVEHWWQARLPLSDSIALTQRNVYILPTGPGLMLAVLLAVLLVASINFQLNLGYLLTFLLAGSAVIGMHVCHGTLRGMTMNLIAPQACYAGASAVFDIKLCNARATARRAIAVSTLGADRWAWTDVQAQGSATVQVAFQPQRRGVHRVPALTAETRFPLGVFRVWTVWRPAAQVVIYPAPEMPTPPLPAGEPRGGTSMRAHAAGPGEFDGVRAYRRGDPMKLVVWKKAAKSMAAGTDDLVSRDTQQSQRSELWLDIGQIGLPDVEQRLSRLCAWVLQADRLGLEYGLRLPHCEVAPSSGAAHCRQCLEALARC